MGGLDCRTDSRPKAVAMLTPGIHPFWFWNTAMDAAIIRRQLAELATQGCRGAFIHPRQGMDGAYLSDDFRALVAEACREGARLGLEIGITDEFPYPSGHAGGLATLGHPESWGTALRQVQQRVDGGAFSWELPDGAVLDCAAFPLENGVVQWHVRRDLADAVGVRFRRDTYREVAADLSAYNGRRYFACDPVPVCATTLPLGKWLVVASVQTIWLRHKYVGPTVDTLDAEAMARFVAVTHRRYERAWGNRVGNLLKAIFVDEIQPAQWSRHLPDLWRKKHGTDLLPLLPALVRDDHPQASGMRRELATLRRERFADIFLHPVRAWCRSQGVVLAEERPLTRLSDAAAVDLPGCDCGHTRFGAPRHDLLADHLRGNARAAGSAAHWYGKSGALCEGGHSLGWGATLEDLRVMADGLQQQGITHLVTHAAFASTNALHKHDAPPSFFFQQTWWGQHHLLAERWQNIHAAFAGTAIAAEVLLVDPSPHDGDGRVFSALCHGLLARQREFLIADVDRLDTVISSGKKPENIAVVVPPCGNPEPALTAALARLAARGVVVLHVAGADDLDRLPPPRHAPWAGVGGMVHRVLRQGETRQVALVINQGREATVVTLPDGWQPLALDGAAPEFRRGWVLAPAQAMLAASAAPPPVAYPVVNIPWPEPWQVRPLGANLLRLGKFQLSLGGVGAEITHFPMSEQLARSGLAFAPTITAGFGSPATVALPHVDLTYRTNFTLRTTRPIRLLMELGTLVDEGWRIRINAGPAFGAADLTPMTGLADAAVGIEITPWLMPGVNLLHITVSSDREDGGLRNPLYLAGDFAVLPGAVISDPVPSAPWRDVDAAGLPFAACTMAWEADVDLPPPPPGDLVMLDLPHLVEDAYAVRIDDGPWVDVPWAPRRALVPRWQAGRHRLRIRHHRPLARCFHDEGWDAAAHRVTSGSGG